MVHIGIIGTGNMANSHAENYSKITECKVTACCDVNRESAEIFAKKI